MYHRRRLAVAASQLLGNRPPNRAPKGFMWEEHVKDMTEAEFTLRYRLRPTDFDNLLDILEPGLQVGDARQAANARQGCPIQVQTRLAVALRYLAGGDPLDLKIIYDMSKEMVMRCVWKVVDAINCHLDNINLPLDDVHALAAIEADFAAGTRGGFWRGQVGAIDGVHFKMKAPSAQDVPDPIRYHVARKDCYALLCVAVCDYKRRFTDVDFSHAPCTHDSTAHAASALGVALSQGRLDKRFFLNGDAAFAQGPQMVTPSNNDPAFDAYDFYQSSNRMAIECAFGILIRRWGVLWRPLAQAFNRRAPLIVACMRLHNYCIDCKQGAQGMPSVAGRVSEIQPGRYKRTPKFDKDGVPVEHLDVSRNSDNLEGMPSRAQRQKAVTSTRDRLAKAVSDAGYVRPPVSKGTHRVHKNPKGKRKRV